MFPTITVGKPDVYDCYNGEGVFGMAKFIGSALQTENWGEDYLIEKLMEYLDDSYVIYRNRPIFGAQFDVALFAPRVGIIIFEVKAWKPDTIKYVKNSDSIVIRTFDPNTRMEDESGENPTNQVRGYVYKMRSKIRQKTGKTPPFVHGMVCFPNLTKEDYDAKGISPVCEIEETILKEDLATRASLIAKLNTCVLNHKNADRYLTPFTEDFMFRVRQIFETDLKIDDQNIKNTNLVEYMTPPRKAAYSILSYISKNGNTQDEIKKLAGHYALGTKLYLLVSDIGILEQIRDIINETIKKKGLATNGPNLEIDFESEENGTKIGDDNSYIVFNCAAYYIPDADSSWKNFVSLNGEISSEEVLSLLEVADQRTNFNLDQFKVEHADVEKNVIVRAGAGTGKTHTMIARIAYICHMQNCTMKEMANRIVMITFTDDAANQMEEKIKQHFNNYYLLTGDTDCLAFINMIEGMRISTIHSYAKKVITSLGLEFGYGTELSITSGDFKIRQIIAESVNDYIKDKQKKKGNEYVRKLGMPIYQINKNILTMLTRLHNQSVDVASLNNKCFGFSVSAGGEELHELISYVVPVIEKQANEYFRSENRLHLNNMMSMLDQCINNEENVQRLLKMQTGRPQFMFVDEFQDTDDVQIGSLKKLANLLQYRLFVVGDVKQCIYRFRGAQENAFEKLDYRGNSGWDFYSLVKNYRTDKDLLNIFHNSFSSMGEIYAGNEPLLIYGEDGDPESARLKGTKSSNNSLQKSEYYKKVTISDEDERIPALFREIERQKQLFQKREEQCGKMLQGKNKEIAILVRENWQAETIKKAGKEKGIDIQTNTGGDLYTSKPALDMLTLANALLHYDEADYLYAFVSSNFIGGGISKGHMFKIREKDNNSWKKKKSEEVSQTKVLQDAINKELSAADRDVWKDWNKVVMNLRTMPVLQVLRKLYQILKPWVKHGRDNIRERSNYRLNVDLLFEELIRSVNADSVSINTLVDILKGNIVSQKNVDSRELDDDTHNELVIRCVTVHKAKGLEYGAVILPYCSFPIDKMKRTDMNVSVFPEKDVRIGYQIKLDIDHVEATYQNNHFDENSEINERMREEARILYVAMTRAISSFSWISLENKRGNCWQNLIWEEQ